jgi:aspartyl protease
MGLEGNGPSQRYIDLMFSTSTSTSTSYNQTNRTSTTAHIKNLKNWVYLTEVQFGNQDFIAVIDTGSADTWLVGSGYRCLGSTGSATTQSTCKFGKAYTKSSSFVNVAEQKFATKYADGETLQGGIGRETVTLGGVTVKNQTVGIVQTATWKGDGQSSGLIGMAFPSLTRALANSKTVRYDPVFFNMYKNKLIDPVFSVALNRPEESPGVLALGGLPGSHIKYDDQWAKVPMEKMIIKNPKTGTTEKDFTLYAVKVTSFEVNGKRVGSVTPVIIDSGTTMSYLPAVTVDAMAAAFQPPATNIRGMYAVSCSAKAPKFGITFNSSTVYIDGKDLVLNQGLQTGGVCTLGIQGLKALGAAAPFSILGGPFMKSVVSVFDVGAAEIRFANRIR